MAFQRTRRRAKPLLPGFLTLVAALLLIGSVLGLLWLAGKALVLR